MSPGCSTAPSSRLQTAAQPTPMEASVVPSQLVELGQQALTDVRISVANGEPLVRCQLLASEFHEALKRALRAPELSPVERCAVIAAANQCLHAANASISPGAMVLELTTGVVYAACVFC